MQGPRQGVHLSPQHMQQWRQLHRFVQWRKFQFRDPDATYVYRARIEPRPPQLPAPPAEPKQHNAAFPSRSHLLKQPSSAGSSRRPSSATSTSSSSPAHQPPRPMRMTSTTTLSTSNRQTQGSNKQDNLGGLGGAGPGGQLSGSEFTLSATAMSIQPRQPTQRSLATGKTNKQLVINTASFPYPDPTKVKGEPRFLSRLGELARLEAETVRSEQAKARLMLSARSRPSSARSLKSSFTASASSNSKSNSYTYQYNRRTSVNTSVSRGTAAIKRQNSSPAVSAYNRSTTPSSSLAISKQLLCTNVPTQTQARKIIDSELDSVKEATSKSSSTQDQEEARTKLSITVNFLGDAEDELKVQRPPDVDVVVDGLGDGSKDQKSCSPPIVHIPAPPFKCSWSVGEGEGDSSGGLEKHGLVARENSTPEIGRGEGESKNCEIEATTEDTTTEDASLMVVNSNQDSASCQSGHTPGNHSDRAVVEDDLKVTSDLGLSIDSLHLSEEESVPEPPLSNAVPPGLASTGIDIVTCTLDNGVENGLLVEYGVSAKTLIPGNDKFAECDIDVVSEAGSTTKRAKKKRRRRLNKLTNGSSSIQIVASSSSTSLKDSKTVRSPHKTVKQSTRRHTKK